MKYLTLAISICILAMAVLLLTKTVLIGLSAQLVFEEQRINIEKLRLIHEACSGNGQFSGNTLICGKLEPIEADPDEETV